MPITGFSNERTSEYMILNDLYSKVKSSCHFFYPFYYHKNRDDTILSLKNDLEVRVVACFARRPKTDEVLSSQTVVSFRKSIFDQANYLQKHGFPVIIGSPLGTSIQDICFGSKCQWFLINEQIYDDLIEVTFHNKIADYDGFHDGIKMLEDEQLSHVLISAPQYSWQGLVKSINDWYEHYRFEYFRSHVHNLFDTVSGCKPLFIAYKYND